MMMTAGQQHLPQGQHAQPPQPHSMVQQQQYHHTLQTQQSQHSQGQPQHHHHHQIQVQQQQQLQQEILPRLLTQLKSKDDSLRISAAGELKELVTRTLRESTGETQSRFSNDLNRKIFELIHSNDSQEKIAAITAIDSLMVSEGEENTTNMTRFANYLRIVLPGSDPQVMELAAKALGKLALPGGSLTSDFVDFEVKRALEWLQGDRNEPRRHAAALVLTELARNAPTLLYAYVSQIFDLIWITLRDQKVAIREASAQCLSACLQIVQQRETHFRSQWYTRIANEALKGLQSPLPESIHGSLLAYRELLLHSGMFMQTYYQEVCEVVLKYREHREALVRRCVITLIPTLASYNPAEFVSDYLHRFMLYLISQLRKDRDSTTAFIATGQVAIAVGSGVAPYLDPLIDNIKDCLSSKVRTRPGEEAQVFACISMLATAMGQALTKYTHGLLDLMFARGLSESLRATLVALAQHIPPLFSIIQIRLLDLLSTILVGRSFQPPGAPASKQVNKTLPGEKERPSVGKIILALNTLGSFDFTGQVVNSLVCDCAAKYLDHDTNEIRKAAALTCCRLLVKDPICFQTSSHAIQVVGQVLRHLIQVAIADPVADIRYAVLSSLTERFDKHLAQADNVRSLLLAFNDESFMVREQAIQLIGRLAQLNPAYVLPSLRKALIQLLTELEYSTGGRDKEESAKLLKLLITASSRLVKPYVGPILKVLLPKASSTSPGLAASVLASVGELSYVGADQLNSHLSEIMSIIITTLQDHSSSAKRHAALKSLGQIATNTGYVVDPFLQYPVLLPTLISILKVEQLPEIRRETIKLLGILGALDPYRLKLVEDEVKEPENSEAHRLQNTDVSLLMIGLGPQSDEYFPTVVINALVNILRDPSLSSHHTAVVQALMYIFKTLGLKCVPFLPQILPGFLHVLRTCPSGMLEFYFQQLGILVSIVKQHIRPFLPEIFTLISDFWKSISSLQITMTSLIEAIANALEGAFKTYLPQLLPQLLHVLDTDRSERRQPSLKVLHALQIFGSSVEENMHLIVPAIVEAIERSDSPPNLKRAAMHTLGVLAGVIHFADYSSRVVHPLARMLASSSAEVRNGAMDTICSLMQQLQGEFLIFVPLIEKMLDPTKVQSGVYRSLLLNLQGGKEVSTSNGFQEVDASDDLPLPDTVTKKLPVNQQHLKSAWEASRRSTREDWQEWMRRISVELLKESPSHALRACAGLAAVYFPLARELFNAAFVSCWSELYEQYQEELVRAIELALTSPNIPPEVLQTLLNLAEFMEHDDKALPIDIRTLGAYAAKCHAYAKALHYKELEFISEPSTDTIEALISINNQLQQPDAAIGILTYAQQNHDLELKEGWYEKLNRWEDALSAYERKQQENPDSFEITLGRMRCLHALGEWELLSHLAQDRWKRVNADRKRSIAPLAAAAAWGLAQWDLMDDYISIMKTEAPDRAFFKAILSLHRNQYAEASANIGRARDLLDTELTALVGESYNRAYSVIVRVQMLAELEEIIDYKQNGDQPARQEAIRKTWMTRLRGCQRNVEVWQRILKVRALVVSPTENMDMWIKFANLCRKSGRLGLAEKTLNSLLSSDGSAGGAQASPQVIYAHLKYMWSTGVHEETLSYLREFTSRLADDLGFGSDPFNVPKDARQHADPDLSPLLARCYLKQGEWQKAVQDDWTQDSIPDILRSYLAATQYDPHWYKAWHAWALANFEVISHYERVSSYIPTEVLTAHIVPAVQGFFSSIALSQGNSLQDALRLLTLWFKFASQTDVSVAIADGFNTVNIDVWLDVLPQLIARIHAPSVNVRRLTHQLLTDIGKAHPQALVYPLTVATKSQSATRQKAATTIMERLRDHSGELVEQALVVSQELIRVAILWHEMWHEGLEEASRLYFGEHNIEGMFQTLEPLHEMLDRGAETLREVSFQQSFARDLQDARDRCRRYRQYGEINDLNQAWDLYYHVFRRITRQLPQLTTLELQYVSPKLLAIHDLKLAVPGTYSSGKEVIRITSFVPTFTVITSKQRPRRFTIKGNDGKDYQFLLKGHEDIRQDERVMQLFGLVNTLLAADPETFKRHLAIERYPVIPLSPNSGLLGWVLDSDTLHVLIRDYRESRKILLNIEHRLMLQMAPDYDNLTLLQKVEVFEYALENTTGQDLYRVLWLKSRNSEAWLDRRTNYTRSLAVMSMVGYILGLGDRHPSNLMLNRHTGKIIHIDFGDCFEVAMHREKFPEKIPFRLTRMLTHAMEVSGIEGSFRVTSESVMRVLRDNKESLMAVLEAFIYDPLINWRLMNVASPALEARREQDETGTDGGRSASHSRKGKSQDPAPSERGGPKNDGLNQRALVVVKRVQNKLTGRDFKPTVVLDVPTQVERLIQQATSLENLCQCFVGWCAFW